MTTGRPPRRKPAPHDVADARATRPPRAALARATAPRRRGLARKARPNHTTQPALRPLNRLS